MKFLKIDEKFAVAEIFFSECNKNIYKIKCYPQRSDQKLFFLFTNLIGCKPAWLRAACIKV